MFMRRIAVIGAGYVGLTTAACLASLGHRVACADSTATRSTGCAGARSTSASRGWPSWWPRAGRGAAVVRRGRGGRGRELCSADAAVEVVFLCVPTPMGVGGVADLSAVEAVLEDLAGLLPAGCVVVNKSTVPVGTAARTAELLGRDDVAVVSNPEFLREGSRGARLPRPRPHRGRLRAARTPPSGWPRCTPGSGAPTVLTDAASAEMIKYAANCFLAMKLSYVNAIAELCERLGADVADVTEGIGSRPADRPGVPRARPGLGRVLPAQGHPRAAAGRRLGGLRVPAAAGRHRHQRPASTSGWSTRSGRQSRAAAHGSLDRRRLGLLGLTFKAGTDDLRDSPALAVAALLRQAGAELVGLRPGGDRRPRRPSIDRPVTVRRRPLPGGQGRRRAGHPHRVAGVPGTGLGPAGRRDQAPAWSSTPATCSTPMYPNGRVFGGSAWVVRVRSPDRHDGAAQVRARRRPPVRSRTSRT